MKPTFKTIEHGSAEWTLAVKLREEILRKPLGDYFREEELEEEKNHFQIVGYVNNELIATAVLVPEGLNMKMQRVVVTDNLRNFNIGSLMMAYCEGFARDKNVKVMYCHARDTAVNFYLKNGYKGEGDYFDEDGIPHWKMTKRVDS